MKQILELTEYMPCTFARDEISAEVAESIWRNHSAQVAVEWPTVATDQQWRLTAQGWVGIISLPTHDVRISMLPKVPLSNLFAMLEVAYDLESLFISDDHFDAESLPDFVERLALIFARRVLLRCRRGIYRAYVPRVDRLPVMRGRMEMATLARESVPTSIPCRFNEQTADVIDNQILLWTLHGLIHSGLCGERTLPTIRQAFRTLAGFTSLRPISAQACRAHLQRARYSRLNHDYRILHSLALFILEQSSPSHRIGDQLMLPFVVNMAQLYERFVAKWLAQNLESTYSVQPQERHNFTDHFAVDSTARSSVHFEIDLVIYAERDSLPRYVMDTKYKAPSARPSAADIAQVLAYAQAKNAPEALLIYPVDLPQSIDFVSNGIRVRSATFGLEESLFDAGQKFLSQLDL